MIKTVLKKTLPLPLKNWLIERIFYYQVKKVQHHHKKALKRIRKKEKIKVAFFIIQEPAWKCDSIYKLMDKDERFEPIIIVNPFTVFGEDNMLKEMNTCFNYFKNRGYNVIKSLNVATGQWLAVKKEIKPDIIFFTNPYFLTKKKYYITNFLDTLTCYIPYGYMLANIQKLQFDQLFHNLIWKGFYETKVHKMMAEKYARNKGKNVTVLGFPMCDIFLDKNYTPKDVWKINDRSIKRIIWAPHHTIEDNDKELAYSNFLIYYQYIIDLLQEFNGKIQIAFKPHPSLKPKLYQHADWGPDKTDTYYKTWQNLTFGQLEEGDYEDLFLTSDAMILDSISFIAEYLFINKPSLFLIRDETIQTKFNEFGDMAFDLLYKAYRKEDITNFINQIVLNGDDQLLNKRSKFKDKYLVPPNNQTAGFNIFQYLVKETTI